MQYLIIPQIKRCVVLAMTANIPINIVGPPGGGKTALVEQVAASLGMKLYATRLSDKEPSDIGGIPYPDPVNGKLRYLMPDYLPYDKVGEASIVFKDELDRCEPAVQNAAMQVIEKREINGHVLSNLARIVTAMNGTSSEYTTPLSNAMLNRMVHVYMESGTDRQRDAWLSWAEENEVSPLLRGFARWDQEVFSGQHVDLEELATATPRSFHYAARIITAAKEVKFPTADILRAMIEGCVGTAAGTKLMAFAELYDKAPSMDEIMSDPDGALVPKEPSLLYALGGALIDHVVGDASKGEQAARYGLRWPEEPAGAFMRRLLIKNPGLIATSPSYVSWQNRNLRGTSQTPMPLPKPPPPVTPPATPPTKAPGVWTNAPAPVYVPPTTPTPPPASQPASQPIVMSPGRYERIGDLIDAINKGMAPDLRNAKLTPDINDWVNRIEVLSASSGTPYTISQRRSNGAWGCSCPRGKMNGNCKHIQNIQHIIGRI